MIRLKACPRCTGDVNLNQDIYGEYEECLQCGYIRDISMRLPKRQRPELSGSRDRGTV